MQTTFLEDTGRSWQHVFWMLPCLLLLGVIFHSSLAFMFHMWNNEDFNYCYLVPAIVAYLIWDKRELLVQAPRQTSWAGFTLIVPGMVLFWVGELGGEYTLLYLSMWLQVVGLCIVHFGIPKIRAILFAVLFSLTMFPLPAFINNKLSMQLKMISSRIGVDALQFLGVTAYREGNVIDLGFTRLQVVDACSGLRYLIPLIVLSIFLSYLSRDAWWKKVIVVLSSIPISILINGFRIASVGLLVPIFGPVVAEGFFHDFSGWIIFMISLGILLAELWVLNWIFKEKQEIEVRSRKSEGKNKENERIAQSSTLEALPAAEGQAAAFGRAPSSKRQAEKQSREQKIDNSVNRELETGKIENIAKAENRELGNQGKEAGKFGIFQPQFIVAVLLLGATAAIAQTVNFREEVPIARSFSQFPLSIGAWTGQLQFMEQKFIDELDLSDYIIVNYRNGASPSVNFYTAYYESQRKGESIHSPASCLPGGGWEFQQAGRTDVPISEDGRRMFVNRAVMSNAGYKQLSYYWFPMRGRILTNAYQMKLYNFWDALTQQRTDGALVRLITPISKNETIEDADARLQAFTQELVPVLDQFLPK
jgi:EpsI family protein